MTIEYATPIQDLLKSPEIWARAAEVIRAKLEETGLSHKQVQDKLGVSQPTVWRFMNGAPTRMAFQKRSQQLAALLSDIGLSLDALGRDVQSDDRWLCIDRIDTESGSSKSVIECPSLLFRLAGDHVEAIPTDPRSHNDEKYCRYCGTQLSARCPYCRAARVVAGSHCPACGENYVAGVPQELRGLAGQELAGACEKRNQANRQTREHAEVRSFS